MSVRDRCQNYRSSSNVYWKHSLGDIIEALKIEHHPDQEIFSNVAWTLMMHDKPGYWCWLDLAIDKLMNDPMSRLDPPLDLLDYGEMSDGDLVDKYENISVAMSGIIYLFTFISLFSSSINAYRGDFMSSVRDGYNRFDPDSTLNGFFPFWGILLLIISFIFLMIAGLGLVGYLVGCRSPPESLRQQLDPATLLP